MINLVKATSIIIGNCIGSGAFTCATRLYSTGNSAFIGWLIAGFGSFSLAYLFLMLAEHKSIHVDRSMHQIIAANFRKGQNIVKIVVLYLYICFASFSNAALANLVLAGVQMLAPNFFLQVKGAAIWVYLATFMLIYLINACRMELSDKINICLSLIKFSLLIGLPIICIAKLSPLDINPSYISTLSLSLAIKAVFKAIWPFVGMESIAIDTQMPVKHLKRGLLLGSVACFLIYVLNTYAMFKYVPNLLSFNIADQKLIMDLAPCWAPYFNLFIVFLGLSCLNSWTATTNAAWRSAGKLAPEGLKRYANAITCGFGLLASIAIKCYCPNRCFDFIFDSATVLLLFIYYLGTLSFFLGWRNGHIRPTVIGKCIFIASVLYLPIVSMGLLLDLI